MAKAGEALVRRWDTRGGVPELHFGASRVLCTLENMAVLQKVKQNSHTTLQNFWPRKIVSAQIIYMNEYSQATLFIVTPNWKELSCPSVYEGVSVVSSYSEILVDSKKEGSSICCDFCYEFFVLFDYKPQR